MSLEATWFGHLAQRDDGALELRQRRRVFLRDDLIDLVGEVLHRIGETDQVFRRHQSVQRVAHFRQPVLDAAERGGVDAGLAAFGDAPVEIMNLAFEGFDGTARHRVAKRAADLAELRAQRVDRLFEARIAQRLDLLGDIAEQIFQARQVLRRRRGRRHGRLRLLSRCRRGAAVEHALAGGDFGDGAVEARRQPHVRQFRRRPAGEFIEPAVDAGHLLAQRIGLVTAAFRRVGYGSRARELLDALRKIVEPMAHRGEVAAVGIAVGQRRRLHAFQFGLLDDHGVEPIGKRHAGPARRLFCGFAGFRPYPFQTPRHAKSHCSHPRSRWRRRSLWGSPWNRHALTTGG